MCFHLFFVLLFLLLFIKKMNLFIDLLKFSENFSFCFSFLEEIW